ncbi:MAG: hypothetical protein ACRDRX_15380 [Pseudonocardiaceae bacterium]
MDRRLSWAGLRLRSLAVGYLRLWPTDPAGCADTLTVRLRVFAHLCGLVLADMHIEHPNTLSFAGAAFRALVEALRCPLIGMHRAMLTAVAVETGADVLVMPGRPRGAW